jgi:LmbE family N-acetylglucosaminyl deacetylase
VKLRSLDQVDQNYRHIYLQPHFDDAALSCGGTIALQKLTGQKVLVVTAFGGAPAAGTPLSPFARQLIARDGLGADAAEAVGMRQAEDEAALTTLGADAYWLDFADAPYRGNPATYPDNESLFGQVQPSDQNLDEEIAKVLLQLHQRASQAVIYAPLGVGRHVDHQICCSAADRLAQQKITVKFYEDYPHVTRKGALEGRQKELGIAMEPEMVEISNLPAQLKEDAILHYRSQVPVLFQTEDKMRSTIKDYASSIRRTYPGIQIERYWTW